MILDKEQQFSDAQAVTADALSTNFIDTKVAKNLADGGALAILLSVDVAADFTTGDETYEVQLRSSANADMSSATTHFAQAIAASALTAGAKHVLPLPLGVEYKRYLALYYNVAGTTPTVTVTAFLAPLSSIELYRAYADNITIS